MTDKPIKHFPRPTPETEVFWQGCHKHELLLQRCRRCSEFQFYPRIVCTHCAGDDLEWVRASGRGEILTFTIVRRPVSEAYADDVPYVVALIGLEEGPTMMCNIVRCDPESLQIGDPVHVLFEDWSEDISIPQFSASQSST
jgi:uncharacterized OB-fold protein